MNRRPPTDAPPGMRWVVHPADGAEVLYGPPLGSDRKCGHATAQSSPYKTSPCNARAVVLTEGGYRCPNHMAGLWIEYGVVWQWVLEPEEG